MKGGKRQGAGRKPGSPNKEKKENARLNVVRVRLSEAEHNAALLCADAVGETMSEFIRSAIQTRCKKSTGYGAGGLNTMATAPKDGIEILAYAKDGKNFHPVCWKTDHWGMRWNQEYCTRDGFYSGWIPYPTAAN